MAPPGKSSTRVFVMRKLFRRRKQEASGLLGASRAGKAFALSILQFEFHVLVFKDCITVVFT